MQEFQIGEHIYRTEKLNTFDQFHLARKVAPLLPKLLPALPIALTVGLDLKQAIEQKQNISEQSFSDIAFILEPALEALSSMPKNDIEYVIGLCLMVAKRKSGDTWMAVWHNNALLIGDMDMTVMLQIVWKVIQQNLSKYFPTGRSTSPTGAASQ